MLVLRRKIGTCLIIAKHITVRVLAIEGNTVKIGVDAPPDVAIVRGELVLSPHGHATSPHPSHHPESEVK